MRGAPPGLPADRAFILLTFEDGKQRLRGGDCFGERGAQSPGGPECRPPSLSPSSWGHVTVSNWPPLSGLKTLLQTQH